MNFIANWTTNFRKLISVREIKEYFVYFILSLSFNEACKVWSLEYNITCCSPSYVMRINVSQEFDQ